MKGRQVDIKKTKQVRIDNFLHKLLKVEAARQEGTLKELVERYIDEGLNSDGIDYE